MKSINALQSYNTFGINAQAEHFVSVKTIPELRKLLSTNDKPLYLLGGGSNILLLNDLKGLVIKIDLPGIQLERDFGHAVYLSAGAGVNWHELVQYTMSQNLGGIENLSLIPGTVGAAPIQNIGAYGVELKDVFHKLQAMEIATRKIKTFRAADCQFGYRNSVFKNKLKGKYIITKVWFKLYHAPHRLHLSYGALGKVLAEQGIPNPTIQDVSNAVIRIRQEKLPDPAEIGNAGSFFKNPVITKHHFQTLVKEYPNIPHYPQPQHHEKIPAAWLIQQCGWKGKRVGQTGTHVRQPLVLVNYGEAIGQEIYDLAQSIQESVRQKFKINLEMEVNVWK